MFHVNDFCTIQNKLTMYMVQKHLKLKCRLECQWRVDIQAVGWAFKMSRVLIQDVGPSFSDN